MFNKLRNKIFLPFLVAAVATASACATDDLEGSTEGEHGDLFLSASDESDLRALSESGKLSPELMEQMISATDRANLFNTAPATYRVVVNLNSPTAARMAPGAATPEVMAARRADIQLVQEKVITAMASPGEMDVVNTYQNIPGFSAEVTSDKIMELVQDNDVAFIEVMPVLQKQDAEAHAITNVNQIHAAGLTGEGVVIAVIDDGIDHDHPAFGGQSAFPNNKILGGFDFGDNDADPTIDCLEQSHGTAVAGVAAGDGAGVVGTAPDAKLVFLKVQRRAECGQPSLSGDIIGALDWVVSNRDTYGIDIASMSLGGGSFASAASCAASNQAYTQVADLANSLGITVVAASGNSALSSRLSAPACVPGIISVGATYDVDLGGVRFGNCEDPATGPDQVTCYSNSANFLDILAPAHCALTAAPGGGQESCFGGTSSATPYASGVIATLLAADPSLTPSDVLGVLTSTGAPIRDLRNNLVKPRVDAAAAHAALDSGNPGGPGNPGNPGDGSPFPILESNLSVNEGGTLTGTFEIPAGIGQFAFGITGGTGDADLYVRKGAAPTVFAYDCRPYLAGNNETCAFNDSAGGTYHVMIRPFRSNVTGLTFFGQEQ